MSHHRWHILERIQVEVAAIAMLAVMYFLIWPTVEPWDVDGTLVFLPTGATGRLVVFAGAVWLLSGLSALLTVSARPEGAMLAALIGAGGACLHSQPMRNLLMRHQHHLKGLLVPLAGELACMIVVMIGATMIVHLVRHLVSRVQPGWVRPDRFHSADTGEAAPAPPAGSIWVRAGLFVLTGRASPKEVCVLPTTGKKDKRPPGELALSIVMACALTLVVGLLLLIVTLSSTERGQILFALAISFFVGATAASFFFPVSFSMPFWIAPIILGMLLYLKSTGVVDTGPTTWAQVDVWAHILPIDWLSAGCGGAVGGYWLSSRLRDLKRMSPAKAKLAE